MTNERVYRTELTPAAFLARSAVVHAERTAVVHGDRRFTYRELAVRCNRLASALRGWGLQHHDRVAILAPNIPAMLEAHLAIPTAGGIMVPVNTRLNADETRYVLEHSGARMVLVDRTLVHLVDGVAIERFVIDDTGSSDDPYEAFLATGSDQPLESWLRDEEDTISINYTSGTTGRPKGVMATHRGCYLNAVGEVVESGLGPGSVYLWTLPMFHCNGWSFPWAVTAAGGTHLCLRAVDPGRVWELIDTEGVTHYNGAPTVHTAIVNHADARPLAREITVLVAGAPPSPTLLGRLGDLGFRPVHVYGLTETYGPHTVCRELPDWAGIDDDDRARRLAQQGHAYTVTDAVRVVDDEMNDIPRDGTTMGEVVMRGNNVMKGYFAQDAETVEAFRGGWFHSGDVAVWHPDGAIELRDRSKDIIISGGENISTIEVEQTICAHPAVGECAVVAIPDDHWGERPKAFVTLRDGMSVDASELVAFCRARLAHFKCPDAVEFCELPKTSTGKIRKNVLRDREWTGRDRRIN